MQDFLIFYAPFIVLVSAIIGAFWISLKDGIVTNEKK